MNTWICTKSRNQLAKERFNEVFHRKARLSKKNIYKVPARIPSDQGPFLGNWGKFLWIESLDPSQKIVLQVLWKWLPLALTCSCQCCSVKILYSLTLVEWVPVVTLPYVGCVVNFSVACNNTRINTYCNDY